MKNHNMLINLCMTCMFLIVLALGLLYSPGNADAWSGNDSATTIEAKFVGKQVKNALIAQPIPAFNWSFERHMVIQLYKLRNQNVVTHSVWRGDTSIIEGDCASIGFGIPYDTSLTNPYVATSEDAFGYNRAALASIEQMEPNMTYASKNTAATWVMCTDGTGGISPVYVETKVTVYPGAVTVDYDKNRVKMGKSNTARISLKK